MTKILLAASAALLATVACATAAEIGQVVKFRNNIIVTVGCTDLKKGEKVSMYETTWERLALTSWIGTATVASS